ncbi:MAG: hypothetical protein KIS94_09525 [Chitinophagales bacterium]|nr:hypothetical protein [Chitinophagales bacterium]
MKAHSYIFTLWLLLKNAAVQKCAIVTGILLFTISLQAAKDSTYIKKADYYIDDEQERIDRLDGVLDGYVNTGDPVLNAYANKVYFKLIDSIQSLINKPVFDESKRKLFRDHLYLQLRKINLRNYHLVKRYDNLFRFMLTEINSIANDNLLPHLLTNISQSFNTFGLFKNEACADSFLIIAARTRPDVVFRLFDSYSKNAYAERVVIEAAKTAPVTVKRYFNKGDPVYEILKSSNDTVVKVILQIMNRYTRKSNAFTLIDDIMAGKLTIEKADAIGKQPEKYLRTMLNIRARKSPLGEHSIEKELEVYALKFVRIINDLHNERDAVRFASIENFTPEELYTLIVYSEEEIFTSTFNGLFNRLMVKLGPVSGLEFLKRVGDNRFRVFIKMCAGFGKLKIFLQTMTPLHQQMLMIKFASGLEEYNDLSQAVHVADAFGSITDSLVLKILRSTVKVEYIRLLTKNHTRGIALYGLLSNLFVDQNIGSGDWFASVAKQYSLPGFDKITNDKLFDRDEVNRWLIYFYDDEDGDASFASFRKIFSDTAWTIIDSTHYVLIQSKRGKEVHIYANKPKSEYEGQAQLEKLFADNGYEPNVMVHRGHSYYASKTIEKVRDNTQVFVLGSCGGYHSISTIIERSSEASIISSKQIGTMYVNNPMLKLMADNIREGKDVEWQPLWDKLGALVKDNPKALERFMDYIPPHKNLGAIFIKTYNSIMERSL